MIDKLAIVHPSAVIGKETVVWAFASIHAGAKLGDMISIGEHAYIGSGSIIGNRTRIGQGAHITDHMIIGDNVFIAPHVIFCNDRRPRPFNPNYKRESPQVEDDVSIGVNATILPGVLLGRGCIIGAGAVVTKNVLPYTTVYGNPAQEQKKKSYEQLWEEKIK